MTRCSNSFTVTAALCATLAFAVARMPAQCANTWLPGDLAGTDGEVFAAVEWDPDGAGPATPLIVFGCALGLVGAGTPTTIATFDPATLTWGTLGSNFVQQVFALAVLPNGDLIAAGGQNSSGGLLSKWNGTSWVAFAPGLVPFTPPPPAFSVFGIQSLAVMPNGDLVAGGGFAVSGTPTVNGVARWNGTTWTPLGAGSTSGVTALAALPNGDLVATGTFLGGTSIARWDGTSWVAMGPATTGSVTTVLALPNGDVMAAGSFTSIGGVAANRIARWNGATWSPLGGGINDIVLSLELLPNGDVVAGGIFSNAGGVSARKVARWNGSTWSALGTGIDTSFSSRVRVLRQLSSGKLLAAGEFTTLGTASASRVAMWNGTTWAPPLKGFNLLAGACVKATATAPNGDLVVGGNFTIAGVPGANSIARWNGTTWSGLGNGFPYDQLNPPVYAVAVMANGDVLASGTMGGGIVKWNGLSWSTFAPGSFGVEAMLTLPNGDLLVGGSFTTIGGVAVQNCARWNGTTWSPLVAGSTPNGTVNAIRLLPNGDVLIAGSFNQLGTVAAGGFARTDGTNWTAFGTPTNGQVFCATALPGGDVVIGGWFSSAGGAPVPNVARWNGTSWSSLGGGINFVVYGLETLPDGDVVAVGNFSTAGGNIARWDGTSWTSMAGLQSPGSCVRMLDQGRLLVGGYFRGAGGVPAPYLAQLDTTCRPSTATSGLGCSGSGGANTLTATTLPWVDSTFRTMATGLPTTSIVLTLFSFTPIAGGLLPLSLVFPQAGPGCDLLVAPDIIDALVTTNGTAESSFFMPNVPPLVGVTFYHQMIPIEVGAGGAWTSVTATNALQITPGMF